MEINDLEIFYYKIQGMANGLERLKSEGQLDRPSIDLLDRLNKALSEHRKDIPKIDYHA